MIPSKQKYWLLGISSAIGFALLLGIPTALIKTPFFTRMIPSTPLDYVFFILSSLLMGAYVGVHYYKKNTATKCTALTTTGGVGSFLAFACPICNKLLVLLFGTTILMTYLEPYRPLIGVVSTGLLGAALYWRIKT